MKICFSVFDSVQKKEKQQQEQTKYNNKSGDVYRNEQLCDTIFLLLLDSFQ